MAVGVGCAAQVACSCTSAASDPVDFADIEDVAHAAFAAGIRWVVERIGAEEDSDIGLVERTSNYMRAADVAAFASAVAYSARTHVGRDCCSDTEVDAIAAAVPG